MKRALETLMNGRTVIAIAHRVSTLDGFDRLITLENGRVAKGRGASQGPRAAAGGREAFVAAAE